MRAAADAREWAADPRRAGKLRPRGPVPLRPDHECAERAARGYENVDAVLHEGRQKTSGAHGDVEHHRVTRPARPTARSFPYTSIPASASARAGQPVYEPTWTVARRDHMGFSSKLLRHRTGASSVRWPRRSPRKTSAWLEDPLAGLVRRCSTAPAYRGTLRGGRSNATSLECRCLEVLREPSQAEVDIERYNRAVAPWSSHEFIATYNGPRNPEVRPRRLVGRHRFGADLSRQDQR